MSPRPGTFLWLLCHDLTLNWRRFTDLFGRFGGPGAIIVGLGAAMLAHLIAWPLVLLAFASLDRFIESGAHIAGGAAVLFSIFAWMIAQGLLGASRTLHDRADLDLLLASPLSPRIVFAARVLALAASSFGSVGLLLLPIANTGALLGRPGWLVVYPILLSLAVAGTAAGVIAAMAVYHYAGPRRARLIAQLTATAVAGGFVLSAQVWAILPDWARASVRGLLERIGLGPGSDGGLVSLGLAAMQGEPKSLVLLMVSALLLITVAILVLSGPFHRLSLAAAGAPSPAGAGDDNTAWPRFSAGVGSALRRKEWLLLMRDPSLFAQLSLQIIYTVPLAIVLARSGHGIPLGLAVSPALVVIAAQITASLAWLTVSGEDAPELIATAPAPRGYVEWAKLSAIAVPVAVILALPLAGLAYMEPQTALATGLLSVGAAASTAMLNFWHPMPGHRRGMLRRHSQSKLIGLAEHGLALLWALATVLVLLRTPVAVIPIFAVAGLLAAMSPARPGRLLAAGWERLRRCLPGSSSPGGSPRSRAV
jgi:ABC-2 type transport system permease protein